MLILILSTGRVEQRLVEITAELVDDQLAELRVAAQPGGRGRAHRRRPPPRWAACPTPYAPSRPTPDPRLVDVLTEAMSDHRSDERVAVGGTANLARFGDSFDTAVRPLLEALEEHVVLLKLIGEVTVGDAVTVRIGHEGPYSELASTSVVATGYGPPDQALATLGVVGPTRMDYPGSMAAVRAVARYVSRILDEGQQ